MEDKRNELLLSLEKAIKQHKRVSHIRAELEIYWKAQAVKGKFIPSALELNRLLRKRIKRRQKRKEIQRAISDLSQCFINRMGGISYIMGRTFRRCGREVRAAVTDNNPLLEVLKRHGNIASISGGSTISEKIIIQA